MLSKKEVKYIQSLCHKRKRDEERMFVAEGPKMVAEVLHGGFKVEKVYATADWINDNKMADVPVVEVSELELERISQLQTPNQAVVLAAQKQIPTAPEATGLTLVLDGLQDPGNLGTIIRIADWFGIKQIICSADCADFYNVKVVQSSMGSIARVQCWYMALNEWLDAHTLPVYGALLEGDNVYTAGKISDGVLIIGNESKGIRNYLLPYITKPVTIPKLGEAESLNAAVATGIILSHLTGK